METTKLRPNSGIMRMVLYMSSGKSLKDMLVEMYPLHRTLVSDGTDTALGIIGKYMPKESGYEIETYEPGKQVWTWKVPERYVVHDAYLETEDGERVVDFKDNPLHLVSYSLPTELTLSWDELSPHLYYSEKRTSAIPWMFKFYERDWGFCLSKEQYDKLPRNIKYNVVIKSEFVTDPERGLKVGVAVVHPEDGPTEEAGEILVCSHVCHPFQANDDLSGVVSMIHLARKLVEKPLPKGSMSIRFLFCPETIGSISYLSHHEELIPHFKGGIFSEMTGNQNTIVLQRTRQDNHTLDRISLYVLEKRGAEFRQGPFREVIGNDEMVINGPGVNVPCISISRWPYDEYHTTDDNPDIIHEKLLVEAADIMEDIVRIYGSDYLPKRTFHGPVFLSGYGLWVDWRVNRELSLAMEKIMLRLEGNRSIFEIAGEIGLDYWTVREYIEKFRENDLVVVQPVPSTPHRGV